MLPVQSEGLGRGRGRGRGRAARLETEPSNGSSMARSWTGSVSGSDVPRR